LTAVGAPGRTEKGQFSLLVQSYTIEHLALAETSEPRKPQRQRKRTVAKGEQLVIERAEKVYGQLFQLEEVETTGTPDAAHFEALDPANNIPDKNDAKRVAWAGRKRPQIAWMVAKAKDLLRRRELAGLRARHILVCLS
jgi:hypothetical protein